MQTWITVDVQLGADEAFPLVIRGVSVKVRAVRCRVGHGITVYGARVYKNGSVASNATHTTTVGITDLPRPVHDAVAKALRAVEWTWS